MRLQVLHQFYEIDPSSRSHKRCRCSPAKNLRLWYLASKRHYRRRLLSWGNRDPVIVIHKTWIRCALPVGFKFIYILSINHLHLVNAIKHRKWRELTFHSRTANQIMMREFDNCSLAIARLIKSSLVRPLAIPMNWSEPQFRNPKWLPSCTLLRLT